MWFEEGREDEKGIYMDMREGKERRVDRGMGVGWNQTKGKGHTPKNEGFESRGGVDHDFN